MILDAEFVEGHRGEANHYRIFNNRRLYCIKMAFGHCPGLLIKMYEFNAQMIAQFGKTGIPLRGCPGRLRPTCTRRSRRRGRRPHIQLWVRPTVGHVPAAPALGETSSTDRVVGGGGGGVEGDCRTRKNVARSLFSCCVRFGCHAHRSYNSILKISLASPHGPARISPPRVPCASILI